MAIRIERLTYSAFSRRAGERASQSPHYEFGALYALFFVGDVLLHAAGEDGDCLLSVSEGSGMRRGVAFAPAGPRLPKFFVDLSGVLAKEEIRLSRIKHVPASLPSEIAQEFGRAVNLVGCGGSLAEFEDRYPQIEWDLRAVLANPVQARDLPDDFPAAEFSNWRYQVRRFIRLHGEPATRPFDSKADMAAARALAEVVAREMREDGKSYGDCAMDSVERFLERLQRSRAPHFGRVTELSGRMIGLTIGGAVTKEVAALYVHIADRRMRGGAQLGLVDAMHAARSLGFERLCIGGSETESLHRFKAWNFGDAFDRFATARRLCEIDFRIAEGAGRHEQGRRHAQSIDEAAAPPRHDFVSIGGNHISSNGRWTRNPEDCPFMEALPVA